MKTSILFALSLLLAVPAWAGRSPRGRYDNCAEALNAFAESKVEAWEPLPWHGASRFVDVPQGWTRLTFPAFDPLLLRMGVAPGDIERMKQWMWLLRVEGRDASDMLPDEPQVLASYALAAFMRLTHEEPHFALYAAVVSDEIADAFPLGENARYLVAQGNFDFVDAAEIATLPRLEIRRGGLDRPLQAVLLRHLPADAPESAQEEWFADLMAVMQRRSDYVLLSHVVESNLHRHLEWLSTWLGFQAGNRIAFAVPQWPLFLESRAELVRAWTLYRIRGGDWDSVFFESQERALEHLARFVPPEALEPYRAMENGLYWDFTMAVAQSLRTPVR